MTILSAPQSQELNKQMINLCKANPEKAVEFYTFAGMSPDEAQAAVDAILNKVEAQEAKERLGNYFTVLEATAQGIVESWEKPDESIEVISLKVAYDSEKGWYAGKVSSRMVGEERMKSAGGGTGGGSGGGRARVKMPDSLKEDGITNWTKYLESAHPDEYEKAEAGASYSAPRLLASLGDEVYLAAAAEQGVEVKVNGNGG